MRTIRLYTLLALLMMAGGVTMQAQELEPVEIFSSPTVLAYHICEWDDSFYLLNSVVMNDGRFVMLMDHEGNLAASEVWYENTNTCSFLTESKFFQTSNERPFFYYVKGPDRPIVCKVTISENFELTTFEFPDQFPIPEEIPHDQWWDFEWLPNEDGSVFVSSAYIDNYHSVHVMARYNESGELTHQWTETTDRATTSLLPPKNGTSGCRLVMDDTEAKDVNSECVVFDDSLNVVDVKHSIYNQAIGIYRPHYEYFAVHPETDMVYLLSDVSFPAFNGNPEIKMDIYMSQFDADFTQKKYVLGPYTNDQYDQKALCESIDFRGDNVYMLGFMNTAAPGGGDIENVENFYVALFDGNMNLKGEIYYHNEKRMLTPYSIYALPSGGCLVSTGGVDRLTFEQQHAIYKLSDETIVGIEEAHEAGFAVAVAYPNPGKDVLNIRTAILNAWVEVYDINGRMVYRQEITENVTAINADAWPAGLYVWKMISDGKEVENGKWIKK